MSLVILKRLIEIKRYEHLHYLKFILLFKNGESISTCFKMETKTIKQLMCQQKSKLKSQQVKTPPTIKFRLN